MRLGRQLVTGGVLLTALFMAAGAAGRSTRAADDTFVKGIHFSGTPFGAFEFDDPTGAPLVVFGEFNLNGPVPNSFGAIINSGSYLVVKADTKEDWNKIGTWIRPGASLPPPDPSLIRFDGSIVKSWQPAALPGTIALPEVKLDVESLTLSTGALAVATFPLGLPGDLHAEQLYKNAVIDGKTYPWLFEDIDGNNRVLDPQPPLTPNVDRAISLLQQAEQSAKKADKLLRGSVTAVRAGLTPIDRSGNLIQLAIIVDGKAVQIGELLKSEAPKPALKQDSRRLVKEASAPHPNLAAERRDLAAVERDVAVALRGLTHAVTLRKIGF